MIPSLEQQYLVEAPNHFADVMSNDAFGITVCLYTFSNLSFSVDKKLSRLCATQYHAVRDYALAHPSAQLILRAID